MFHSKPSIDKLYQQAIEQDFVSNSPESGSSKIVLSFILLIGLLSGSLITLGSLELIPSETSYLHLGAGFFLLVSSLVIDYKAESLLGALISIALLTSGCGLIYTGSDTLLKKETYAAISLVIVGAICLTVSKRYMYKLLSTSIAVGALLLTGLTLHSLLFIEIACLLLALVLLFYDYLEAAFIHLEDKNIEHSSPIFYGIGIVVLAISILLSSSELLFSIVNSAQENRVPYFLTLGIVAAILYRLKNRYRLSILVTFQSSTIVPLILVLLPLLIQPGILLCTLVVAVSYWLRKDVLIIPGLLVMLLNISLFYYSWDFSLALKSGILLLTGVLLLLVYRTILKEKSDE